MTRQEQEWVTLEQIAQRYRRPWGGVYSMTRRPLWRERVRRRRRGNQREHHAIDVDRVIRTWVWVPPVDTGYAPDELLTVRQIAEYSGYNLASVRLDATWPQREYWLGPPEEVDGGVRWWRRSTVDERFLGRMVGEPVRSVIVERLGEPTPKPC